MQKLTIALIITLLWVGVAQASWMFAISRMAGGQPDIDLTATPVHGWVLSGRIANYGAYLFSGTNAQLLALNALPQVVGIVGVTISTNEDGVVLHWAELDNVINAAVRTKLNNWLTNNGYPTIPADWTNKQVIRAVWRHLRPDWDWNQDWVKDE